MRWRLIFSAAARPELDGKLSLLSPDVEPDVRSESEIEPGLGPRGMDLVWECVVREVRQRERVVATLGPAHRGRPAQQGRVGSGDGICSVTTINCSGTR